MAQGAAMAIEDTYQPTLQLVYLPHLDYCLQKLGPQGDIAKDLAEIDALCGQLLEDFQQRGCRVVVLSEYGITPVQRAIHPNRLLRDAGLNIARFVTLTRANRDKHTFAQISGELGLPLFVKPANQGSSVGVSKVTSEAEFTQAVRQAFEFDHKVVVEQGIKGREIECAVLGNDFPQASTCGEVVLNSDFYSYDTKYIDDKGAQVVVPADIDPAINDKIRAIAISAYQTLGCSGMARVDVFLTPENEVVINEINTLPGFTNISMYPKLWQASGLSYPELITRLIELALERHAADSALKSSVNG